MNKENENVELSGEEIFSDWSSLLGEDKTVKENTVADLSLDDLMVDGGDSHWLSLFQKTNLLDMDLVALKLRNGFVHDFKKEREQLKLIEKKFMMNLPTTHLNDLRIAGLSEDQIGSIKVGVLPINWTIHIKRPLAYGGVIEEENMVLIPHYPFHEEIHRFLNEQIVTDAGVMSPNILYMPTPKSAVYVPFGMNEMADHVIYLEEK